MQLPDVMLVDSGTTSHMTALDKRVASKRGVTTDIHLADDSTVTATRMGVRTVVWRNKSGLTSVRLSRMLVARSVKTSLLSVPASVKKDISVLFVPGKARFIDILNRNTVIGFATQRPDGVFYIADSQDAASVDTPDDEDTVRGMMETVGSAIDIDTNSVSSEYHSSGDSSHSGGVSPQTCTEATTDWSELASDESTSSEGTASFRVFYIRSMATPIQTGIRQRTV